MAGSNGKSSDKRTLPLLPVCNGVGLDITDEEQVAAFIAELKDYNAYLNRTTDHDIGI